MDTTASRLFGIDWALTLGLKLGYGLIVEHFKLKFRGVGKLGGQVLIVIRMVAAFSCVTFLLGKAELATSLGSSVRVRLSHHSLGWSTTVESPLTLWDLIDKVLLLGVQAPGAFSLGSAFVEFGLAQSP